MTDLDQYHIPDLKITNEDNICPTCKEEIPWDMTVQMIRNGDELTVYHIGCAPYEE